jgi:hypothetical protein
MQPAVATFVFIQFTSGYWIPSTKTVQQDLAAELSGFPPLPSTFGAKRELLYHWIVDSG